MALHGLSKREERKGAEERRRKFPFCKGRNGKRVGKDPLPLFSDKRGKSGKREKKEGGKVTRGENVVREGKSVVKKIDKFAVIPPLS